MKYIKNYKVFENNTTNLTDDQKDFLNKCALGTWEVNPDTGLIDIQGNFNCYNMNLNDFKGLRFGNVSGSFDCEYNNLKTLNGSPREVGVNFWCRDNPLISLEGAPLEVGRCLWCLNDFFIEYNLNAFVREIKKDRPGLTELLLTHHFFTPEIIKQKIQEDNDFLINLLRAWNTLSFEKKQDELLRMLSPEIIQKINNSWAEKIKQDDEFCKSFCKDWNIPEFKTKQDELTRTLSPKILQKIKDFSAVSGYF